MKTKFVKAVVVAVGAAGLIVPRAGAEETAMSGEAKSVRTVTAAPLDVALTSQKTLRGQVVSAENAPQAGLPVTLSARGEVVAQTVTDGSGAFQMPVSRGGVYVVAAGNSERVVRTWTEQTAPPAARDGLLMIADDAAVRGQAGSWIRDNIIPLGLIGGFAGVIVADVVSDDSPSGS